MNNLIFQNELLDLAEQGYTLIVESQKLAHQLQWRHRMRQRESGRGGWIQPDIVTLNDWVVRFWQGLWPETWPASMFERWRLLLQVIEDLPPPQPLIHDISLVLEVDEAFEHCLRYGLDPNRGETAGQLIEWRRSVWEPYRATLIHRELFHPASLPEKLLRLCEQSSSIIPEKIAIVGFEFAGYWEQALMRLVRQQRTAQYFPLPIETVAHEALACANPDQEMHALLEDLTASAMELPLHELAVVILNPDLYAPLVTKYLRELFGPPLEGEHAAYNLLPNRSLAQQPIFQSALLPLEFGLRDQPRILLLSLLRSPYYGFFGRVSRSLMQWDWIWREKGLGSGLRLFVDALSDAEKEILPQRGAELIESLSPFLAQRTRTGRQWIHELEKFWRIVEFPVLAKECDQIGWQRFREIMAAFDETFGQVPMNAKDLVGWLRAAAEKVYVQERGLEDAGIQIIGRLDARGLAFERVYIPGLTSGTLPQPAQPFPLLSREERKKVQGGTLESQYTFAFNLFQQFQMMAPKVTFSRPLGDTNGEDNLSSPFWPADRERTITPTSPWRHDLPALQRAGWIEEGITGVGRRWKKDSQGSSKSEMGLLIGSIKLPEQISVSKLEVLLTCPVKFLFQDLLEVEPLTEIRRGLDPRKRGQIIHGLLKDFGERITRKGFPTELELNGLIEGLDDIVSRNLAPFGGDPCWDVERRRLVGGDEGETGLLHAWLESEWGRIQKGWRWFAFETAFSGLRFQGSFIAVNGRLDRLDYHREEGYLCWDYKTGAIPRTSEIWEKMSSPQLPVYLIALAHGLVSGVPGEGAGIGAGYIDLQSVARLKHAPCFLLSDGIRVALKTWEERISAALKQLEQGDLFPRWSKDSCESDCPYQCLCEIHFPEIVIEGRC